MRTHDRHDGPAPARGGEPELRHDRLAEVRRRLREGHYDSAEVLEEVARRMRARGDL